MDHSITVKQSQAQNLFHKIGDNCIQNFHLGRYIVGYKVRNLETYERSHNLISNDIPPQMNMLNMVIPILMRFYAYYLNHC